MQPSPASESNSNAIQKKGSECTVTDCRRELLLFHDVNAIFPRMAAMLAEKPRQAGSRDASKILAAKRH